MKGLILLNALSGVWYVLGTSAAVLFLIEPRFSWRKTLLLYAGVMIPTSAFDLYYYWLRGSERGGQASRLIITLPTLILYFLLSRYRDGRPIFTYFFIRCLSLDIISLTNILNTYLTPDTYYINFFGRLALYPLLCWWIWRGVKEPFRYVLRSMEKDWGAFALIAALNFVTAMLMFGFPTAITSRPAELPAMLLFLLLMPLTIWRLFDALRRQQELHESHEREQLLDIQTAALERRVRQTELAEKRLNVERHDQRHRILTLRTMLERGDTGEALRYVDASAEALAETKPRRWCENTVLDAMFAAYFATAEAEGIRLEASLDVPEKLDVSAAELSTVFANALENAIQAVRSLPEERRVIRCECIRRPQLMFSVSNPYEGTVRFDDEGRPVASKKGHGFCTASIAAYCEKHGAFCDYAAEDGWFTLRMVQP